MQRRYWPRAMSTEQLTEMAKALEPPQGLPLWEAYQTLAGALERERYDALEEIRSLEKIIDDLEEK